jgi:phosphate/phosphite/phosphonate ABC transporter binding protein
MFSKKPALIAGGLTILLLTAGGLGLLYANRPQAPAHVYNDPAELTIEVTPYLDPAHLIKAWTPLLNYLSVQTGRPVHLRIAPTFEAVPTDLSLSHDPMAYGSVLTYIQAHHAAGYVPIVGDSFPNYGLVVVRADSPLQTTQDASVLRGKKIAIPSRSASPYLFARGWALTHGGVNLETDTQIQAVKGLDAVIAAVLSGSADAGIGFPAHFFALEPGVKSRLRIIAQTDIYPQPPIMIDANLSPTLVSKMRHALLAPDRIDERDAAIAGFGWKGVLETGDKDFDPVRALAVRLGLPY